MTSTVPQGKAITPRVQAQLDELDAAFDAAHMKPGRRAIGRNTLVKGF
jgi:hypothetical protein